MIDLTTFKRVQNSAYFVNAGGDVYSEKRNRLLSPSYNQSGHRMMSLKTPDGVRKTVSVHRLVMELFGVKLKHLNREQQLHARQITESENAAGL